MRTSGHTAVVAIDGGGTHCRVAYRDGTATRVVETGPSNVSTDFDGAVREILDGFRRLAEEVGLAPKALGRLPAFVGVAGMTGPEIAGRLSRALPFAAARIEDDRPAAVRGVLGGADGFLGHCGTGSFFASQIAGAIRLSGGWGPVLGDEASAQWIGRRALRIALEQADGLCPASPMGTALLDRHGGTMGIVKFAGTAKPPEFGRIGPYVTRCAGNGDVLAERVLQEGADEVARNLTALGWTPGREICLTGGIGPHFIPYLPPGMQASRVDPRGTPLDGALSLASDFAAELRQ